MYDAFEDRGIVVLAVAQEDTDLESHAKMAARFEPAPRFEIAADLERKGTGRYHRTSSYFITKDGVVRQVFPQVIHHRAHWGALLAEIDRVLADASDP